MLRVQEKTRGVDAQGVVHALDGELVFPILRRESSHVGAGDRPGAQRMKRCACCVWPKNATHARLTEGSNAWER